MIQILENLWISGYQDLGPEFYLFNMFFWTFQEIVKNNFLEFQTFISDIFFFFLADIFWKCQSLLTVLQMTCFSFGRLDIIFGGYTSECTRKTTKKNFE